MQSLYARPVPGTPGKIPEMHPAPAASPPAFPAMPLDLPRLVMRRALAVALGALALALALGLLRVREDTRQEMAGSLALARLGEGLAQLAARDPAAALASLRALEGLRHLRVELLDAGGRRLLRLEDEEAASGGLAGAWPALSRRLGVTPAEQSVSWTVSRPDGETWTVVLTATPDSELQEALSSLAGWMLLLLGCSVLMLAVMQWNVRRALRPLQALLGAIAHVERQDLAAVRALPAMPIRELEAISLALKHLAQAQERTEAARRVLGHRLLGLQEDERQRLARDLHDEFGQRLTALRVDAAWLQRRLAPWPPLQEVAAGMGTQVALIQDDVRRLLARLRPLGPGPEAGEGGEAAPETLGRLRLMLEDLVAGWSASGRSHGTRFELALDASAAAAGAGEGTADALPLPRELVLGVYRISQEALTNVARHAGARQARLELRVSRAADGAGLLEWSVRDDGCGLAAPEAALQRGTGLAGLKDRVWALGGEFDWAPAPAPDALGERPGLVLRARLPIGEVLSSPTPGAKNQDKDENLHEPGEGRP